MNGDVRTVGIVSPGAMGSAVGAALARGGARVVVSLAGRSARTHRLAEAAGLTVVPGLEDVVRDADVVLSIAPPEAAAEIAAEIGRAAREAGAQPLVADLNAIAPETARALADRARARPGSTSWTGRSPARRRGSPARVCTSRASVRTRSPTFRSTASSASSSAARSGARRP